MEDLEGNFKHMKFRYDDYQLDIERKEVLKDLQDQFMDSLKQDVVKFIDDPLCTVEAIHITGTEGQAKCLFWFQKRCFLVTASGFKVSPNIHMDFVRSYFGTNEPLNTFFLTFFPDQC